MRRRSGYIPYRKVPIRRNKRLNSLCKYELLYRIGNPEAMKIKRTCDIRFATPRIYTKSERLMWRFQWGLFRYYDTDFPEVLLVGIDRAPTYEELDKVQGRKKRNGHSNFQILVMFRIPRTELKGLRTLDYYYGDIIRTSIYSKWLYYIPGINCPLESEKNKSAEQHESKIQKLLKDGYFKEEVPEQQTLSTN